ncbi:MAG: hypothetical protein WCF57_21925, partial [Pyrinomonadaceae bacterium]
MKVAPKLLALILTLAVICIAGATAQAQSDDDEGYGVPDSTAAADAAKRLINRDPLVRQRAAEELARLSASDWRHLVEGYRMQEDNSRVKLALDWALYRMGKTETLYGVVRELDSSRFAQAQGYLAQLDTPEPLYIFLEPAKDKVKVRLLEALARTGDAETIERIKPYANSLEPQVARAAQTSMREIEA